MCVFTRIKICKGMERISKVLFDILLILRPIVIVDLHKDLLSLNTNQYYLTFMDKLYLEAQARSREVVRQTCWLSQDLKKNGKVLEAFIKNMVTRIFRHFCRFHLMTINLDHLFNDNL